MSRKTRSLVTNHSPVTGLEQVIAENEDKTREALAEAFEQQSTSSAARKQFPTPEAAMQSAEEKLSDDLPAIFTDSDLIQEESGLVSEFPPPDEMDARHLKAYIEELHAKLNETNEELKAEKTKKLMEANKALYADFIAQEDQVMSIVSTQQGFHVWGNKSIKFEQNKVYHNVPEPMAMRLIKGDAALPYGQAIGMTRRIGAGVG